MKKQVDALANARHAIGLYSISEMCEIFPRANGKPMSRHTVDFLINSGQLRYVSPNGRDRYVFLAEYIEVTTNYAKKNCRQNMLANDDGNQ